MIFMKTIIALFTFMFLSVLTKAQTSNTGEIQVFIKSDKQIALENVTVSLMKSKDSSLVKLGITDENGSADFDHIPYGSYIIKTTMINYDITYSAVIHVTSS